MLVRFNLLIAGFVLAMTCLWPSAGLSEDRVELVEAMEAARTAGLSRVDIDRVLGFGYRFGLSESDTAVFLMIGGKASTSGGNTSFVIDKIEEGLAKHVPISRIKDVVQKQFDDFAFAQRQLANRPGVTAALDERLAQTLRMGLSRDNIDICLSHPDHSAQQVVLTAEFMAAVRQAGLPPALANSLVAQVLEAKDFPSALLDVARFVRDAKQGGNPDALVAEDAVKVIRGDMSISQARRALGLASSEAASSMGSAQGKSAGANAGLGKGSGQRGGNGGSRDGGSGGSGSGGGSGGSGGGGGGSGGGGGGGGSGGGGHGGGRN